jgi:hypothetical protein
MSYMTGVQIRATNVDGLAADFREFAQGEYLANGAQQASMRQIIMGGDSAGLISVMTRWDTIDAAMSGHLINANQKIADSMGNNDAQIISRSLIAVSSERGTPEGPYGSMLTMSGQVAPPSVQQEMADHGWSLMSGNGVNGIRQGMIVAGGDRTGLWTAGTYCESLDGLMENSAKMFSDPTMQANMAKYGNQLVSRSMFRTLVA